MEDNCYVEPIYKNTVSAAQLQQTGRATLAVRGMGCQNCVTRVRHSLLLVEGVYGVDVYLNMALAEVTSNRQKLSPDELVSAVARAGHDGRHKYHAELIAAE